MKIPEIIENRADFCALSTLIGAILGAMTLLAVIVIHFLPGIAGMLLYSIIGVAVVIKVVTLMELHDKMGHNNKFPLGYLSIFLILFMCSLYLFKMQG